MFDRKSVTFDILANDGRYDQAFFKKARDLLVTYDLPEKTNRLHSRANERT